VSEEFQVETVAEIVCEVCKTSKPYTVVEWPTRRGRPAGAVCRLCARERDKMFSRNAKQTRVAARIQSLATLSETAATPAKVGPVSISSARLPGELPLQQLAVTKALRIGSNLLNEKAQSVLERLVLYAESPSSPHHEWALKLIAERLLPRKLYEDLGSQAAGITAGTGTVRPLVTIIVQPATMPAPGESPSVTVVEGSSEKITDAEEVLS